MSVDYPSATLRAPSLSAAGVGECVGAFARSDEGLGHSGTRDDSEQRLAPVRTKPARYVTLTVSVVAC